MTKYEYSAVITSMGVAYTSDIINDVIPMLLYAIIVGFIIPFLKKIIDILENKFIDKKEIRSCIECKRNTKCQKQEKLYLEGKTFHEIATECEEFESKIL